MTGWSAADLLALPVRMNGIQLGRPVDLLLDAQDDRVLGFELACGDGSRRFLPFTVAEIHAGEINVRSALALIDEADLAWYRRHARRLGELGLNEPRVDADGHVFEARSAA
ncbi:MAG TPA: hypothetical protein VFA05_03080 [Gaiellaceae bacterium]|nr:hypothetical protein [Gaiellaceae bacterium]